LKYKDYTLQVNISIKFHKFTNYILREQILSTFKNNYLTAISIGLMVLIILPHGLFFTYFQIKEHQLKEVAMQKILTTHSDAQLDLLKISFETEQDKNVFKRFHSREFRYRGIMYDVVKREVHENETWYWCIRDEQETKLMEKKEAYFTNLWQQEAPQNRTASAYNQYVNLFYVINYNIFEFNLLNLKVANKFNPKNNTYASLKNSPPTPPPIRI